MGMPAKYVFRNSTKALQGYLSLHKNLTAVNEKKRGLMGALVAAKCKTYIIGSTLALAHCNDGRVMLQNLMQMEVPGLEGITGIQEVIATLTAMQNTPSTVRYRDAALINLGLEKLQAAKIGLLSMEEAIEQIAKTIDFAAADEYEKGTSSRQGHFKKVQEMTVAQIEKGAYDDHGVETKVMMKKGEGKWGEAAEDLGLWKGTKAREKLVEVETEAPSTSLLSIKAELSSMMGDCVITTPQTTGYEVIGPLGTPTTRYKCLCCSTEPLLLIDLLSHCAKPSHQQAYAEADDTGRDDPFLHSMRSHQTMEWVINANAA